MEREHERDEFQQEIHRLEAELRQTGNVDNKAHKVRANPRFHFHSFSDLA